MGGRGGGGRAPGLFGCLSLKRRGTSPQIQDIANDGINVRKQSRPLSGKLAMAPGATVALHYTATLARLPSPPLPRSEGLTLLTSRRQCNRLYLHLDQLNLRYDEKSFPSFPPPPIMDNRLIILSHPSLLFLLPLPFCNIVRRRIGVYYIKHEKFF